MAFPSIAILAGGLGTRLKEFTKSTPKAMVAVQGRPFIEHQIQRLKEEGIEKIVLCVGHLANPLVDFLKTGERLGVEIEYSFDGDTLQGTGGAILKALPLLSDPFFLTYGDTFLTVSYRSVSEALGKSDALMTVLRNENQWGESNCLFENGKPLRHNKKKPDAEMKHIDYGLSILRKAPFQEWAKGKNAPFEINEYFVWLSENSRLAGYEVANRFYEIGSPERLEETSRYLKELGYAK